METIGFCQAKDRVAHCQREAQEQAGCITQGEEIWMHHTNVVQQWVQDAHQEDGAPSLPDEYRRHEWVFDEEWAKCFPPKREGYLKISLMPNALSVLDCKVYPLTKEEWDLLHTFLAEE